MTDTDIYDATKAEVVTYLTSLSPDTLARRCEYCPEWTLKDVLAHHIHALRTISTGRSIPRSARTAIVESNPEHRLAAVEERNLWTQSGVDERRQASLEGLLHEWSEVVDVMSEDNASLVLDLSVHYDDIRETLEGQVSRGGVDLRRSLQLFHRLQGTRLHKAGYGPATLRLSETGDWVGDSSGPAATGTTYDLLRVVTSRRTRPEADLIVDWGALASDVIEAFPVYGWPEKPGGG